MSLRWRRATRADLPSLRGFLCAREERCVGFSGRLLREGELRLPSPLRGAVWVFDSGEAGDAAASAPAISGAVLCHPSRLAIPVFPRDRGGDGDFALLARAFAPASSIGMAEDLARYGAALGLSPLSSVGYLLMTRARAAAPRGAGSAPYPGLVIRRASAGDLEALLPLQEAYEREEVLTPIHEFNRAACRASLARSLERQLVFVAEEQGTPIAKAGTNARGFRVDQVGGVYTIPERRGRGVASALMEALAGEIEGRGRSMALFVKPANAAARALYAGMGFEDIGDYRADYYEA